VSEGKGNRVGQDSQNQSSICTLASIWALEQIRQASTKNVDLEVTLLYVMTVLGREVTRCRSEVLIDIQWQRIALTV
jgi:hypothetical protein